MAASAYKLKVATDIAFVDEYRKLTNQVPCYQQNIKNFNTFTSHSRGTVAIHLICMAFNAGKLPITFEFIPVFDYERAINVVEQGLADISTHTVWQNQLKNQYYVSAPIFRKNEFELGVYTRKDHHELHQVSSLDELRPFNAVSQHTWVNDWEVLEKVKPASLRSIKTIHQIFKMIAHKRADYTLKPFISTTTEMNYNIANINLYPVKGIKFLIPYSRHFVVSKETLYGKKFNNVLNQGLQILRDKKLIAPLLHRSGLINDIVADWKVLHLP